MRALFSLFGDCLETPDLFSPTKLGTRPETLVLGECSIRVLLVNNTVYTGCRMSSARLHPISSYHLEGLVANRSREVVKYQAQFLLATFPIDHFVATSITRSPMSLVPPDGLNALTLTARDVLFRRRCELHPRAMFSSPFYE